MHQSLFPVLRLEVYKDKKFVICDYWQTRTAKFHLLTESLAQQVVSRGEFVNVQDGNFKTWLGGRVLDILENLTSVFKV